MMTEAKLKSALMTLLRAPGVLPVGFVALRHEDRITAGHPDISVTGHGATTWLEAKHAHPAIRSRGIQELTMLRLGRAGRAFYVIYLEKDEVKETLIVHPSKMENWLQTPHRASGFNHRYVASFIKQTHVEVPVNECPQPTIEGETVPSGEHSS